MFDRVKYYVLGIKVFHVLNIISTDNVTIMTLLILIWLIRTRMSRLFKMDETDKKE